MAILLIADDEEWIRESIRIKLSRSGLPIEEILEVGDAEGALALLEKQRVDIIICDIRMGGMDGLTLCGLLSQRYPLVQKIIISGYSEFDYAVRAIQEGVASYLLKPIDSMGLFDAVKSCLERAAGAAAGAPGIAAMREAVYENSDNPALHLSSPEQIQRLVSAYTPGALLAFLSVYTGESNALPLDDILAMTLEAAGGHSFGADLFFFKGEALEYVVMLSFPPGTRQPHSLAMEVSERLVESLRKQGAYDAVCGLECGTQPPLQAFYSARRIMHHRVLLPEERVVTAGMAGDYREEYQLDRQLAVRLEHALAAGNYGESANLLQAIEEDLGGRLVSYQSLKGLYGALLDMVSAKGGDWAQPPPPLWRHSSVHGMLRAIREMHQSYINITYFQKENTKEHIANRVRDYLDNHYDQHISLEELANCHYVAPAYLSILFKEAFGVNFQDYLLDTRIRNAKKLLDMGRYKIKTVAGMTGFNDQHYFSRVFKKMVGMSPREYLQKDSPPQN